MVFFNSPNESPPYTLPTPRPSPCRPSPTSPRTFPAKVASLREVVPSLPEGQSGVHGRSYGSVVGDDRLRRRDRERPICVISHYVSTCMFSMCVLIYTNSVNNHCICIIQVYTSLISFVIRPADKDTFRAGLLSHLPSWRTSSSGLPRQ